MSNFNQKIQELLKNLFIIYEYEKPTKFPIKYISSLNLIEEDKNRKKKRV
jgi:hypothetical protein